MYYLALETRVWIPKVFLAGGYCMNFDDLSDGSYFRRHFGSHLGFLDILYHSLSLLLVPMYYLTLITIG